MADNIDDQIRSRMREEFPVGAPSQSVLESLHPRMRRARTIRHVGQTVSGAAGAAVIAVGLIVLLPDMQGSPDEVDTAAPSVASSVLDEAEATGSDGSTADSERALVSPSTSVPLPDEAPNQPTTIAPIDEPTTAVLDSGTTTSPPTTVPPSTTSVASTTAVPDTTSTPGSTTTTGPTTTQAPDPAGTITTDCGSLVVELDDAGIRLVSTDPNPGMSVDVHDSGPAKVEVSFENGGDHCEVVAENRDGEIWSDVENE